METKLLILTQPPCLISTPHRHRQPHPPKTSFPHHLSSPFRRSCTSVYYRRWDSNVETQVEEEEDEDEDEGSEFGFGGRWNKKKKKKKRRWWSDDSSYTPETEEGSGGILEEVIDSFWIFKVYSIQPIFYCYFLH